MKKIRMEVEVKMGEPGKHYFGNLILNIEEYNVTKNFVFRITDVMEDKAGFILQEGDTILFNIQGATAESIAALSDKQKTLLDLVHGIIQEGMMALDDQYDASPEIKEKYEKAETIVSGLGGNIEFSAKVSGELTIKDMEIFAKTLRALEIPA